MREVKPTRMMAHQQRANKPSVAWPHPGRASLARGAEAEVELTTEYTEGTHPSLLSCISVSSVFSVVQHCDSVCLRPYLRRRLDLFPDLPFPVRFVRCSASEFRGPRFGGPDGASAVGRGLRDGAGDMPSTTLRFSCRRSTSTAATTTRILSPSRNSRFVRLPVSVLVD